MSISNNNKKFRGADENSENFNRSSVKKDIESNSNYLFHGLFFIAFSYISNIFSFVLLIH